MYHKGVKVHHRGVKMHLKGVKVHHMYCRAKTCCLPRSKNGLPSKCCRFNVDHTTTADRSRLWDRSTTCQGLPPVGVVYVCVPLRPWEHTEAWERSSVSKMRFMLLDIWMISPLIRHSFLLSSSTVFMLSIQRVSMGPSNTTHLRSSF